MTRLTLPALSLLAVLAAPVVASEPAAPPAAARSSDEIVCKKFAENGTLIRKRKVCMTRAEWRRLSEDAQHHTAKLAADNVGGNIGCTGGKPGC